MSQCKVTKKNLNKKIVVLQDCHAKMMQPPFTPESEDEYQDELVTHEEAIILPGTQSNFEQNFIQSGSVRLSNGPLFSSQLSKLPFE